MPNFDFLRNKKEYTLFSNACIETEKVLSASLVLGILGSYEALKSAVQWVFAVENISIAPKYNTLQDLISDPWFKSLVNDKVYIKLSYVVKLWKFTLKSEDDILKDDAVLALSVLFEFVLWIDYMYGLSYTERSFSEEDIPVEMNSSIDIDKVLETKTMIFRSEEETQELMRQISSVSRYFLANKEINKASRKFVPIDFEKIDVREHYLDLDLKFAGWDMERDVKKSVRYVVGNSIDGRETAYIDYELLGRDGLSLAIIEAKYSLEDLEYGRRQAIKYAGHIGSDMRRVPMIFLISGANVYFMEELSSIPRKVKGLFNLDDLQRLKNQTRSKKNLVTVPIDNRIVGRQFQIDAIKAVCNDFLQGKRRSMLLLTGGSEKIRVIAGLIDQMSRANYITSALYITGREAAMKMAKDTFKEYVLNMSLGEYSSNVNENGRLVVSTTDEIIKVIGNISGSGEKYFSPGEFDLIVIDELYRSTVTTYSPIFEYFDALIVGASSLPKDDIDQSVYDFFKIDKDDIAYTYHYEEALQKDKLIVPYNVVEIGSKVLENGVFYDQFKEEDKGRCEETYTDDPSKMINWVPAPPVNEYLMNSFSIDSLLDDVMKMGIKISKTESIGKTIIFAQNMNHGEMIVKRFRIKYPHYGTDFIKMALCNDSKAVEDFLDPEQSVNILVDVGFATMGLDIPEVVNIVLFKKIYSKFEFYQMINIGNRICPSITCIDSKDGVYTGKKRYYIFDYLGNFEFFNETKNSVGGLEIQNVSEEIFTKCVGIIYAIQTGNLIDKEYQEFCNKLIDFVTEQVENVNQEFSNMHLPLSNISKYSRKTTYSNGLKLEDKNVLDTQIAPLVSMNGDEYKLQFDNFMYGLMLSQIESAPFFMKAKKQFGNICNMLLKNENVPEIKNEIDYIHFYGSSKFMENSTIIQLEQARIKLRKLVQYVFEDAEKEKENEAKKAEKPSSDATEDQIQDEEDIIEKQEEEAALDENIKEYKKKVENYIATNPTQVAIYKLKNNMPLSHLDFQSLEKMFKKRLGTAEEYAAAYGNLPVGLLVRGHTYMDQEQIKVAFFSIFNDRTLSDVQREFLNNIMSYMRKHGYMDNDDITKCGDGEFEHFSDVFDPERQKKIINIIKDIKRMAVE